MFIICLCTIVRSDFHLHFSRKKLTTLDIPLHYSSFHNQKEGIIIKNNNKRLNTFYSTDNSSKTDHNADINSEELPWQIYDRIFKRIFSLSDTAIINLINGLFHEHFPPDSNVSYPNKEYALLSKTQYNILRFPEPVIIYLNDEEYIPEESILHISFGSQGTFDYRVSNYCYLAHNMEELDSKKMVILIPFQVMRLRIL